MMCRDVSVVKFMVRSLMGSTGVCAGSTRFPEPALLMNHHRPSPYNVSLNASPRRCTHAPDFFNVIVSLEASTCDLWHLVSPVEPEFARWFLWEWSSDSPSLQQPPDPDCLVLILFDLF